MPAGRDSMSRQECIGTILIVDDSKSVRVFLTTLLSNDGYTVFSAEDGQQGWETVQRETIDIIISDIEMPEINGFELCELVKEHPEYNSTYFILLSTRESTDSKVKGLEIGADDYMGKSISESELLARVKAGLRIRTLEKELEKKRIMIFQNEKMASIGQLAAGIAHEVNSPLFAVSLNLDTLKEYFTTLAGCVERFSSTIRPECLTEFEKLKEELDLDFILEDSGILLQESNDATKRIGYIVATLKESAEIDKLDCKLTDINACLDDAINNTCKPNVLITRQYSPLPPYKCQKILLNQAFMQLLINAGQAIDECGEIKIRTWPEDNLICISISDNGSGISETDIKRIFDPFFTTKEVGQGTGLGLSVVYDTITTRHQGDIKVNSILGHETTFTIKLPLNM
jgi:two-component system, NtrC family, sensor kinase